MYCELDENNILMGYSDQPSSVSIEIDKPIPASTSTQVVKWDGSDWVVEDSQTLIDEKALYDSLEWSRKRRAEYNALNQLEMQYDDEEDGTTTWKDAIAALKAKWPKDNSGPV